MPPKSCVMCGKPAQGATDFCADCYKNLEDRYRPQEEAPPSPPRDWRWVWWAVAGVCLAVAAVRAPLVARSFAPPKPFRSGPTDTDRTTDQCLRQLWTASRLIQEGRWPAEGYSCPATGRPYETRGEGPDLTVRCPAPEAHRMADLSVGRRRPRAGGAAVTGVRMDRKGYMLLELMVVMLIISVLVSIVLPRWGDSIKKTKVKACAGTRHSVETAEARYVSDTTGVSASIEALYEQKYLENRAVCPARGEDVWAGGLGVLSNDRYVVCSVHGTEQ